MSKHRVNMGAFRMAALAAAEGAPFEMPEGSVVKVEADEETEKMLAKDAARRLRKPRENFQELYGVDVERHGAAPCWAVFSGCEGEDPTLRAVFFGRGAKAMAEAVLEAKDPEEPDEKLVFDGDRAPAFFDDDEDGGPGLYVANHVDDAEAIAALARYFRRDPEDWTR